MCRKQTCTVTVCDTPLDGPPSVDSTSSSRHRSIAGYRPTIVLIVAGRRSVHSIRLSHILGQHPKVSAFLRAFDAPVGWGGGGGYVRILLSRPAIRRMLCDRSLSFFDSFCHSVNRITNERGNGRRPNLAGTGKRWPSRSGWLLVVIRICAWIPDFYFLRHWGISHFPTFVSISLFSQFLYNQQPIWTKLGEMNDANECINLETDIRRTSGSRLIRIRITFVSNFGVGGGLHSLLQTEHL